MEFYDAYHTIYEYTSTSLNNDSPPEARNQVLAFQDALVVLQGQ